ncbi:MAG: acyl-CoA/acyl-ACP dehydrogenase, partial [Proteobacteria bacterium]|nr:acyl-CoA/acyl-ACP dehydrogenase [Pseudomonadota bacterium]
MDFDFSEDEKMVRDQISRFLQDTCGTAACRSVLEGDEPYASKVWQGLGEMGVQGSALPGAYGGVEAGYLTLCLAAQELGAHLAPVPFSSSIYLAAEAILRYGSESQKETWLPRLASGEAIGTLAVTESIEELTADSVTTRFDGDSLSGTKLVVPHGLIADIAVVLANTDSGLQLVLTELNGVQRQGIDTVDPTMASATITFDGTRAEALGQSSDGWADLADVYNRAAVLFAFEQIGGAEKALEMAVAYAKERFAFGRPIGSFQALKHMMADMYVALKLAESNCYYAAWALANDSADLPLAAATARVSATQAFQLCARDNIQVHGGMGFTWEFDCHLYYR